MTLRRYSDPVHRIIILDGQSFSDRLLMDVIDTPDFQRLRRIRQLGLAGMIFHGAEHSRFGHSLGAMHIMTMALDILQRQGFKLDTDTRLLARMGALLHDVGHGPLSHAMEAILDECHEGRTQEILLDPETALHRCLSGYDRELPDRLAALLRGEAGPLFIRQLISSQLDCDRLDYLLRDSLMTGVSHGKYDLPWILQSLTVGPENELMVQMRGVRAVEEYLFARYHMFRQVYLHPGLRAVQALLQCIFQRARHLFQETVGTGLTGGMVSPVFRKLLRGCRLSPREYLSLDDHDLWFHIKQWQFCTDPILSDLCRRFVERKLFRTMDTAEWTPASQMDMREHLASLLEKKGYPPEFYLVEDTIRNIPYSHPSVPTTRSPGQFILVTETGNGGQEISAVSAAIQGLRPYVAQRFCFPEDIADEIGIQLPAGV